MKIGLVIYGSLDTLSGGYLYDRMLVRQLRATGCQVDLLSLPWRNYAAHLTDNLRWPRFAAWAKADYDLLLQDELNHPSLCLANLALRRQLRGPIVSIVHHLRSEEDHPRLLKRLYRVVETQYLRSVDGFIFNSITSQRLVSARLRRSKPGIVVYPAADHIAPPPANQVFAQRSLRAQTSGPLRVLFVGNLSPRKGLHTVLAALALLPTGSVILDVVGSPDVDPAYTTAVHRQVQQTNLHDHVHWHGRVDDATLRTLYQAADLFAVPSYEGFGIVYLEAMAYALPVIASTAGAAHETITPGENGFLIPPDSPLSLATALNTVLHDRALLGLMALRARARYESFLGWADSMNLACQWLHEIPIGA